MGVKSTTDKLLKGDIEGVVADVKGTIERSLGLVGLIIGTVCSSFICRCHYGAGNLVGFPIGRISVFAWHVI